MKNVGHDSLTNVATHAVQYNKSTEDRSKTKKTVNNNIFCSFQELIYYLCYKIQKQLFKETFEELMQVQLQAHISNIQK